MQISIQQKMFKRISRWQQSGLSQKAWCEKNNMAYATFHYWYKLYRDQVSVSLPDPPDNFIKLMVNDSVPGNWWCEVVLSNGKKLVFQQAVSAEFLKKLID
jgi:hypothetical protein